MNDYEVTYILRSSLEDSEVEGRANAIAEIVRGQGGRIVAIEPEGESRLYSPVWSGSSTDFRRFFGVQVCRCGK